MNITVCYVDNYYGPGTWLDALTWKSISHIMSKFNVHNTRLISHGRWPSGRVVAPQIEDCLSKWWKKYFFFLNLLKNFIPTTNIKNKTRQGRRCWQQTLHHLAQLFFFYMWHVLHDRLGEVNLLSKFQLRSSYSLRVKVYWRYFHKGSYMTREAFKADRDEFWVT